MRALLIPILAACAGPPAESPTWRESWELLVLTARGEVVDARAAVGNTGLLEGQGHLRFDRWSPVDSPINFHRATGPGETAVWPERDRVRLGPDLLALEAGTWTLEVHADEVNAVLHLGPTEALEIPPVARMAGGLGAGQWTATASVAGGKATGWVEAGKRGGQVDGRGVLLYRGGDGVPAGPRRTLVLLGADCSLGLDIHDESTLAWARIEGRDLDASGAGLVETREGLMASFPAADLSVSFVGRDVGGTTDIFADLPPPEALARSIGDLPRKRRVEAVQATVVQPGRSLTVPGVFVQVADEEDMLPIPRPKRR